ncbi:MAG: glutamate formimidoyltransferase [Candidatus Stahlbacteria bacterium]|nr:glutamate formimidoyltransferase [Candidatus Stahlbacteria bacterium]
MSKLVECVPNFSEGKDPTIIDKIVAEITKVSGVKLTDRQMNADHHRAVITFVGAPDACKQAAFNACQKAMELIDLRKHKGEHPRMGATDVIPFVPISEVSIEECVELACSLAKDIAEKLNIPTYLYELAAACPERENLANIRKGEFEGLSEAIKTDSARKPDFGNCELHPSAGATVVGVREYLIAYNVNLGTNNLDIAKKIAKALRFKEGGFRYAKALGFDIKERNIVQVSVNATNYKGTSLFRIFEFVKREAERYGVPVISSEVVGVLPLQAVVDTFDWYLRLENFTSDQILEKKVWGEEVRPQEVRSQEVRPQNEVLPRAFLSRLASKSPTPGGGSAAALSGSIAAALTCMVSELTIGKEKYKEVEAEMKQVLEKATLIRDEFLILVEKDEEAFNQVMAGYKLPKNTDEEKANRSEAIQRALKSATNVPIEVIRKAKTVIELAAICAEKGNVNSISDAGVAVIEARTAAQGALYNVLINLGGIKDEEFKAQAKAETDELMCSITELAQKVEEVVKSKL